MWLLCSLVPLWLMLIGHPLNWSPPLIQSCCYSTGNGQRGLEDHQSTLWGMYSSMYLGHISADVGHVHRICSPKQVIVYKYLNTLGNTRNFYLPILASYLSILFQLRLLATLCLTMSCLKSGKGCLKSPLIWCDTMTSNLPTSLHWLRNSQRLAL